MKKNVIRIIGIVFIALLSVYLFFAFFFNNHYFLNTTINGRDFSGLKIKDVEEYFVKEVKDYKLDIIDKDGNIQSIKGADINLKYEGNKNAVEVMESQNMFAWPASIFNKENVDAAVVLSYDKNALMALIDDLDVFKYEQIPSESAVPSYNGSEFEVIPEVYGTAVNRDELYAKVIEAVETFDNKIDLVEGGCYDMPAFIKDSPEVIKAADELNNMLGAQITYKMKEDVVIDSALIATWLKCDEEMNVYIDEEAIKAWLTEFGDTYDTKGTKRIIITPNGKKAEVTGGTYGWSINEIEELPLIIEHIKNKDVIEKEPVYYEKAAEKSEQDWGKTYVEVDLTAQHMWYIQDGSVVLESDIVTGTPDSTRATPQGVYSILEKTKDKTLVGAKDPATGKPKYETPVSFWMRVTWTGIGFHDATWQSSFGGDRYTYAGSHGCINMPYDKAKALFEAISIGTPVIVHY